MTVTEHFADEIKAVPTRHSDRGETMSKVVDPDIVEPRNRSNPLPRLLYPDEMSVPAFGGENIRAAFLAPEFGQRPERRRPKRHVLGPALAVG